MKVLAESIEEAPGVTDGEWYVPPRNMLFGTGTWSPAIASGVPSMNKATADENTSICVPLNPPSRQEASRGAKITAVDLYYSVGTAALTAFPAPVVNKVTAADGTAAATASGGGTLTFSLTTTSAIAAGQRKLTVTLGTPAFIDDGEMWWLVADAIDAAATSVLKVHGAVVKYTRAL